MTDAELILASRTDPAEFREIYDRWAERLLGAHPVFRMDGTIVVAELCRR
jgi:hypothetical protein